MNQTHLQTILAFTSCLLATGFANAQTPGDAGSLQQQIERERQNALPQRAAPARIAAPRDMAAVSGLTFELKAFKFAGNTLLNAQQLSQAVAAFVNRPLDFAQLQAAAAAAGDAYRAAGWIVNAYLPEQDIKDGVVTIQIVEAVFGDLKLEGETQRVKAERLVKGITAQQAQGQPIRAEALDRALLLADDLPGVAVSGALRAGIRNGDTDLVYKLADEPLATGDARADNTGARSTGTSRLSANLLLNSPMGMGDQVAASLMASEGSRYARMAYTVPVGYDGWQVGANASHLGYELVNAPGKGTSQTVGVDARYPLIRARQQNLYLALGADHKNFDNTFNGATSTRYGMDVKNIGLSGNQFDDIGGGGANSLSLSWVTGQRNNQVGSSDTRFDKWRYALSRQQTLTPALSAYAGLEGQHSKDTLDSSESFYLGGVSGVRAYPTNEGRGNSGNLLKVELRWRVLDTLVLTSFYDHGRVSNFEGTPSYSLQGAGLAATWQAAADWSLSGTLARRIGSNPGATTTGTDTDGSLTKNRLWLTASFAF
jgi:hemolysin activation/secretion protein